MSFDSPALMLVADVTAWLAAFTAAMPASGFIPSVDRRLQPAMLMRRAPAPAPSSELRLFSSEFLRPLGAPPLALSPSAAP